MVLWIEDMTADKFNEIDQRLDRLESEFAEYRGSMTASSTSIERLERLTGELADIARLHQQALRLSQQRHDEYQESMQQVRTEIRDIWQYLSNQLHNGGNGGAQS
jgi:archaellum component FlaC